MVQAVSLKEVYDELKKIERKMATKQEVESLRDTIEILSNPDTMRQIAKSMDDIKQGKTKAIHSVSDMLNEM